MKASVQINFWFASRSFANTAKIFDFSRDGGKAAVFARKNDEANQDVAQKVYVSSQSN